MYRFTASLCSFAATLLWSAFASSASAQVSLISDQAQYPPGGTAVLSGSGFAPGELVTLLVVDSSGEPSSGPEHEPWTVAADAGGGFTTTWTMCDEDCLGELLVASADGASSGAHGQTEMLNHDCGEGVVTSVTPVGGACSAFTPAVGAGPDNYEVAQGGTYAMTISGVTECSGGVITVFVQGSSTGNFCFNAYGGSGTYTGTFTMPNPACNTYPVSYKCGADAPCNHPGSYKAQGPTSGCGGVHLRASNFNGSCVKTGDDTSCSGCTPDVLHCPPDVTVDCTASTDPSHTGSPTGCQNAKYDDDVVAGACAGSYSIIRHWTASDGCGGTASCDQTITVTDTHAPTLTCPPDADLDCGDSTDPSQTGMATASDDCSGVASLGHSDSVAAGACAGSYVITRTWTAVDGCGNSTSCMQTITVSDTHAPTLTCPPDADLDCGDSTDPSQTGMATASDDCSGVASLGHSDSVAAGACAGSYVITRTWTAVDGCGNSTSCMQTITVSDTHAPTLTCPPDSDLDCGDSTDPSATGMATATDDCSGVASLGHGDSVAAGACAGSYVITRTWTAVDGCGNSTSCMQTITVSDTHGPTLTCPPNRALDCGDSTDPSQTGMATATDDCSGVASLTHSDSISAGSCDGNYVITRTWTATDGCGNSSSCMQAIMVSDTHAPTLTCPPDVVVTGCCVAAGIGTATASDDCSGVTVTNDAPETFCLGDTVVTWTATDGCGNSVSCQQLVTVLDITLDFETDGGGGSLLHGQSLATAGPEVPYTCPSLSFGPDPVSPGNGNGGAAIFDSTNGPFGQDPDLNVGLGNILYLQRNGSPTDAFTGINGPDTWDHPNDDEDGGTLTFDFCGGVKALSIDLIDIDLTAPTQDASVVLTDSNSLTRTYTVPAGWTANGPGAAAVGNLLLDATVPQPGVSSAATVSTMAGFDEGDVVQIRVRLGSSGAIDNLRYCPNAPKAAVTARNGSGINPTILSSNSMPVLGAQWSANLDCGAYGDGVAMLMVRRFQNANGMSPFGEVLIGGELLYSSARSYSANTSRLTWDIPFDMALCGLEVHVQGLCQQTLTTTNRPNVSGPKMLGRRARLSNALDLILGF